MEAIVAGAIGVLTAAGVWLLLACPEPLATVSLNSTVSVITLGVVSSRRKRSAHDPGSESDVVRVPLAAAAIIVLMIVLLLMNSIAIWLRNRYEQKW